MDRMKGSPETDVQTLQVHTKKTVNGKRPSRPLSCIELHQLQFGSSTQHLDWSNLKLRN
jgi:hypothetical protein